MRIALISSTFLPVVGGIEWKMHFLACEYIKRGHEAAVFTTRPSVGLKPVPMPVEHPYPVFRVGQPLHGVNRLGLLGPLMRRAVLHWHAQKRVDVLHCHHAGVPTAWGVSIKRKIGVPVVVTTCGGDIQVVPELNYGDRRFPRFDRLVRRNLMEIDAIGAISRQVRMDIEAMGTSARILDIPNGVPWEEFQIPPQKLLRERLGLADDCLIIVSLGRHTLEKAYVKGLRAFARVAAVHPLAQYAIVGRNTSALAPLVAELGLAGRAGLIEQVSMADVPRVLRSADIFFNPSEREGFAQANAQALASGLPCVITDAPGNVDAGDHGGAIITRSGDVESMAAGLNELLGDPDRRSCLAAEAHAASRRYAWRRIAEEYLQVFEDLVRGDPRAAGAGREAPRGA